MVSKGEGEAVVPERACVHYKRGEQAEPYGGEEYLRALHRLKASDAVKMAGMVEAFFWSDAPTVRVWLCRGCGERLGLLRRASVEGP